MNYQWFNHYQAEIRIRPAYNSDLSLIEAMHNRVSENSLYLRYLRTHTPTLEDIRQICQINPQEGGALVATVETPGEMVVGYAYYLITSRDSVITAEPAILVEDSFQGQGIGRMLIERLHKDAVAKGVQAVDAVIHPSNDAVLRLIRRSGLPFESQFAYGLRENCVSG